MYQFKNQLLHKMYAICSLNQDFMIAGNTDFPTVLPGVFLQRLIDRQTIPLLCNIKADIMLMKAHHWILSSAS
jgi:hypothetical protein